MLTNIPYELQRIPQWVVSGPDKQPLIPTTGQAASHSDPDTWGTFEEATNSGYQNVGFVLSGADPYCIIDLDNPYLRDDKTEILEGDADYATACERAARHEKILDAFQSYAEVSQSGKGVHIVVKAHVPNGVKRDKVEVYSHSRYMIFTGNVLKPLPIVDCSEMVTQLCAEMHARGRTRAKLSEVPPTMEDAAIVEMASTAANSDQFLKLWEGNWHNDPRYPTQSEADFALLSMLAFYSKSNSQVRRLFRQSALTRAKTARKDYHLNLGLMKIRAGEPQDVDLSEILARPVNKPVPPAPKAAKKPAPPVSRPQPTPESQPNGQECAFPPGFIGDCAQYIYDSAVRPVREVALAAAIGLTAGVVGRAYNISGMGLNHYVILIAKTGRGKETIAKGIDSLISAVRCTVPNADQFIGPAIFASGQGLVQHLNTTPCFVSVLGEVGITLKNICSPNASFGQEELKRVLLDVYAKSGFSSSLRPSAYSKKENNTQIVQSPNASIIGESTPENFYVGLSQSQVSAGLIPRFSIFEYNGPRPRRNRTAGHTPPPELVRQLTDLVTMALQMEHQRQHIPVSTSNEALQVLDLFDEECDAHMNADQNNADVELWNRAHLKALKLAALIAVGRNPNQPVVTAEDAIYAVATVRKDVSTISARFESNDVGTDEGKAEADTLRAIRDWFAMSPRARREYGTPESILDKQLVPFNFLRRRLCKLSVFKECRIGASAMLKKVLQNLVEDETLKQLGTEGNRALGVRQVLYAQGIYWKK